MTTNSDSARSRIGPQMVAIFGSALRPDVHAWDLDVTYHGVTPGEAARLATEWARAHRPDMISTQGDIALDLHEATWNPPSRSGEPGGFEPLQAVESSDPVLALLGPAPGVRVDPQSLPALVRFFARHGQLPGGGWRRLGISRDEGEAAYFGGGLTALRTAALKCSGEQIAALTEALGPVFQLLLARDLDTAEMAIIRPGSPGFESCAEITFIPGSPGYARTGYDALRLGVADGRLVSLGRLS